MEDSPASRVRAAVLVAHPDDETLWAGGAILSHPDWDWFIATLCRSSDPDRAPKFFRVLQHLHAKGSMADLDDSPAQAALPAELVQETLFHLIPGQDYDLVFTHGPYGEYTRHVRHEEVSQAVLELWKNGTLRTRRLQLFAYSDQQRTNLPTARTDADMVTTLSKSIWKTKYALITEIYGFDPTSWEARSTPRQEAFWKIETLDDIQRVEVAAQS